MKDKKSPARRKKDSRRLLKKKLTTVFSRVVRLVGKCQRCGNTNVLSLQCSHVRSKHAHPRLEFDLDNALSLCHKCHIYWWHKEPYEAVEWFEREFPKQAERLKEKMEREEELPVVEYGELLEKYTTLLT